MTTKKYGNPEIWGVNEYHCPNCNSECSIWPVWRGRSRMYVCTECGQKAPSAKTLSKLWGRSL